MRNFILKTLVSILILSCPVLLASDVAAQNTTGYKITGSGMNYPEAPSWATLGVNIDTLNLQDSWLRYYYPKMKLNLISTSIAGVSVDNGTVTIAGTGTMQGGTGFTFAATIKDGSPDSFGIDINGADGTFHYTGEIKPSIRGNFVVTTE